MSTLWWNKVQRSFPVYLFFKKKRKNVKLNLVFIALFLEFEGLYYYPVGPTVHKSTGLKSIGSNLGNEIDTNIVRSKHYVLPRPKHSIYLSTEILVTFRWGATGNDNSKKWNGKFLSNRVNRPTTFRVGSLFPENSRLEQSIHTSTKMSGNFASGKLSIDRWKTDRTRRFYLGSLKRQLKQTALAVKITRSDIETSKVWTINRGYEIFVTKNSSSCRLWVNTNTRKLKSNKSVVRWNRVWRVKCSLLFQINDIDGYSTLKITRKLIHKTS